MSETEGWRWIKGSERAMERRIMHGFMGRDGTDSKTCRYLFIKKSHNIKHKVILAQMVLGVT